MSDPPLELDDMQNASARCSNLPRAQGEKPSPLPLPFTCQFGSPTGGKILLIMQLGRGNVFPIVRLVFVSKPDDRDGRPVEPITNMTPSIVSACVTLTKLSGRGQGEGSKSANPARQRDYGCQPIEGCSFIIIFIA